ncbi:MAG: SurA N-terminal domain-containing protein [Pseudomonadales bacterium]
MLQKMRDQTQSLAFKVLVGIIVFVLAVFGFGAVNLFVGGDPEVARVNGIGITEGELARQTERERRRIAGQMGADFDPTLIDPVRLQESVLEQLIGRALLQQAAEDFGVTVSRAHVDRVLVNNPAFQANGEFQPEFYRQTVQALGYTPQGFIDETAQLMALEQIQTAIADTAFLTERELAFHAGLLGQRRDVAYLPFTVDRFRAQVTVTDEDVQLRYQEDQRRYTTRESVDVEYVTLALEDLLGDPAIEVTEEAIANAYEAERAMAPPDEERRARHILLETNGQRSLEQARAMLQEIRARLEADESFADLAEEFSEDPGSAVAGGDLGFAGRGIYTPAFEEALFALEEPGEISEPVQTEFGYHLIKLEDVRTREFPSLEEMRPEIERTLRLSEAEALYSQRLREMDNLAFEQPGSLEAIEEELGLTAERVEGVTRDQGPGPFADPAVRDRLFTTDVLVNRFNSPAVEYQPNEAVVMRVVERHPPEPIPLESVADDIRDEIETERATSLAREAHSSALARLRAGESTAEVAADYATNWQTFELVRRTAAEVPRSVLQTAFSLPRPPANDKTLGQAGLPDGGLAVVAVSRVRDGELAALSESEVAGMRRFLEDRAANLELGALFQTLQDQASIRRP